MVAAWKVAGRAEGRRRDAVDAEKLDYELFDRWLKFLAKPPNFYPYLTKWQEMVKRGGTEAEAKKLAEEFQTRSLDVMFDRQGDQGRERHHRRQGAAHDEEEEAGASCRTSSSPTTISAPAAAWS